MKFQVLIIFTLVIIGTIAHRNEHERRLRRRLDEENELRNNQIDVNEKETSSASSEIDEAPEDPQVQNKQVRCNKRRPGGRRNFNRNDESVVEDEQKLEGNGTEKEQGKCTRRFRNRQRHRGRHGEAAGHEEHQKHSPEWHQIHNVSMPEGESHNFANRNHEHNQEWHEAHNITMPDVNRHRHRPHHHRHHHHRHHHHNCSTTTSTTTTTSPSPVERSTWNVNEEK